MLNAVGSIVQETEREVLTSLTKFVDQLPLVMNEVCYLQILKITLCCTIDFNPTRFYLLSTTS